MDEPRPAVLWILAEAYRSVGGNCAPTVGEPLLAEVTRIIRIYAEGMKVGPVEVISTDVCRNRAHRGKRNDCGCVKDMAWDPQMVLRVRTLHQI